MRYLIVSILFAVRLQGMAQQLSIQVGGIYNTGHLFGFVSLFNSEAVKKVDLYKNAYYLYFKPQNTNFSLIPTTFATFSVFLRHENSCYYRKN